MPEDDDDPAIVAAREMLLQEQHDEEELLSQLMEWINIHLEIDSKNTYFNYDFNLRA